MNMGRPVGTVVPPRIRRGTLPWLSRRSDLPDGCAPPTPRLRLHPRERSVGVVEPLIGRFRAAQPGAMRCIRFRTQVGRKGTGGQVVGRRSAARAARASKGSIGVACSRGWAVRKRGIHRA
jgi:hypothetical protein